MGSMATGGRDTLVFMDITLGEGNLSYNTCNFVCIQISSFWTNVFQIQKVRFALYKVSSHLKKNKNFNHRYHLIFSIFNKCCIVWLAVAKNMKYTMKTDVNSPKYYSKTYHKRFSVLSHLPKKVQVPSRAKKSYLLPMFEHQSSDGIT